MTSPETVKKFMAAKKSPHFRKEQENFLWNVQKGGRNPLHPPIYSLI